MGESIKRNKIFVQSEKNPYRVIINLKNIRFPQEKLGINHPKRSKLRSPVVAPVDTACFLKRCTRTL